MTKETKGRKGGWIKGHWRQILRYFESPDCGRSIKDAARHFEVAEGTLRYWFGERGVVCSYTGLPFARQHAEKKNGERVTDIDALLHTIPLDQHAGDLLLDAFLRRLEAQNGRIKVLESELGEVKIALQQARNGKDREKVVRSRTALALAGEGSLSSSRN